LPDLRIRPPHRLIGPGVVAPGVVAPGVVAPGRTAARPVLPGRTMHPTEATP
jgi:hypothetical protein